MFYRVERNDATKYIPVSLSLGKHSLPHGHFPSARPEGTVKTGQLSLSHRPLTGRLLPNGQSLNLPLSSFLFMDTDMQYMSGVVNVRWGLRHDVMSVINGAHCANPQTCDVCQVLEFHRGMLGLLFFCPVISGQVLWLTQWHTCSSVGIHMDFWWHERDGFSRETSC